jgi:hypothetical protein
MKVLSYVRSFAEFDSGMIIYIYLSFLITPETVVGRRFYLNHNRNPKKAQRSQI